MRRMRVLTRIFPASSIGAAQLTTEKGEPMKSNESKRNLHVGAAFISILVALGARFEKGLAGSERDRSEEHTSELQSLAYLVCRLLLEKKKKEKNEHSLP